MSAEYTGYGAYPANQPHETGEVLRGFVLLVAGVTQNRRRNRALEDSEAALGGWGGLPPRILVPDAPADVVQLPTGSGPQTVRGYLERASATPGPVLVCVTGHLMPDRRGELHVTLRASSPSSVRYDGLPWAWLVETLRLRDPRRTLVVADLTASDHLRARLAAAPDGFAEQLPLWAVLTRQPAHDERAHSFTRALTAAVRRGFPDHPGPIDPAAVHAAIAASAQLPDGNVQIVPSPDGALRLGNPAAPPNPPAPYGGPRPPGHRAAPPTAVPAPIVPPPASMPFGIPAHGADPGGYAEATALEPAAHAAPRTPPAPEPAPAQARPPGELPGVPRGLAGAPGEPPADQDAFAYQDRVAELREAVAAGDFDNALHLARKITHDMAALPGLGPEHPETLDALETLAWLTARAGNTDEAVSLYAETARRSARIHGPGHPATRAAADAAHALWLMLPNAQRARELGPAVIALRELVLGRGPHGHVPSAAHVADLPVPPQVEGVEAAGAPITAGPLADAGAPRRTPGEPAPDTHGHAAPGAAGHGAPPRETVPADAGFAAPEPAAQPPPVPGLPVEFPPPTGPPVDVPQDAGPALPGGEPGPPPPELRDALAAVAAIAATGRHVEALGAADAVVDAVAADLGPEHPSTLNVREIRAYLTAEAGRLAEAVTAYLDIAEVRLAARGPEHPDTVSAVDNAHVLWLRLGDDDAPTIATGHRLAAVRESVPGPGRRALTVVRGRLARLADRAANAAAPGTACDTVPETAPEPAPESARQTVGAAVGDAPGHTPPAAPAPLDPLPRPRPPEADMPPPTAPLPAPGPAGDGLDRDSRDLPGGGFGRDTRDVPPAPHPAPRPAPPPPPAYAPTPAPEAAGSPASPVPPPAASLAAANGRAPSANRPAREPEADAVADLPPDEVRAYLKAIKAASADADHVAALTLAEELTRGVEARHGPVHPYTLNAYEVRAHLTASAGLFATAARQYTALAHRLAEAAHPDDPGARSAADAAQALWLRLGQTEAARTLAPGIVDLRRRVPGPDDSALAAAYDHLSHLTREV
ncbi:tetratricopeptide repeat protein [Yinghuangia sp. ASG 101]|uniref:tetratricopeptide repeat protein n=1 Tax=Yinghuangia sp. ASG 101 TaxID=2896848 RepID=UPI001E516051|nr:tetratricopeptide repeat protein [Yinghuangia sp. ASG 101]UGQ15704.1 tetratricopeptide repeat protein [Yinghuangia sp. ASG 101]